MKLVLKFIACTVVVLFFLRELRTFFASDEERIQWCVEEMVEGFNDADLSAASGGLHPTWTVPGSDVNRSQLRSGLSSLFFTEKQTETRAFALAAELPEESIEISVFEETATANFTLRFFSLEGETRTFEWEVQLHNKLIEDPDVGWRLSETLYETLSGARLGH